MHLTRKHDMKPWEYVRWFPGVLLQAPEISREQAKRIKADPAWHASAREAMKKGRRLMKDQYCKDESWVKRRSEQRWTEKKREEQAGRMNQLSRRLWKDAGYRCSQLARISSSLKEAWKKPELAEKFKRKAAARLRQLNRDPEFQRKRKTNITRNSWYRGHRMSSWEVLYAQLLDECGIEWEYERLLTLGDFTYRPDFYLPEQNLYVEVKPDFRREELWKICLLKGLGCNVAIVGDRKIGAIRKKLKNVA